MTPKRTRRLFYALSIANFCTTAEGFLSFSSRPVLQRRNSDFMVRRASGEDEDPTKVWYAEIANVVQNALTNSPLNEGKKAFVKMLAGDYDEAATKAKLLSLIEEKPVLMLSFTT